MAVRAQHISQDGGLAGIALGRHRPGARPAGLYRVGMDWNDFEPGLDQMIDHKAGWSLDGDRDLAGRPMSLQPGHTAGQPFTVVTSFEPVHHASLGVDHADGVRAAAPIDPHIHIPRTFPSLWSMVPIAGSPGGMLIDRRVSGCHPRRIFL